ncbi:MAG: hypothetical protein ABSD31_14335 [Candidatus Binataceae bacterium]|jgi:hypothetical protein
MGLYHFERSQILPLPLADAFAFFSAPRRLFVARMLVQVFDYRAERLAAILGASADGG